MAGHALYLAVMLAIAISIPPQAIGHAAGGLVVVGLIGTWRYSWAAINALRALVYARHAYPRLRAQAEAAYASAAHPAHAFFLVTSYKIDAATTARVYQSLFRAAAASAGGATIVASVVESADARLIRRLFALMPVDLGHVRLIVDQIPGTGKRDALARALRLIARAAPTRRDIVLFVDGDSAVPEDVVARAAPFFTDPRLGALTTDEEVEIAAPGPFRDWFELRFTQRQVMMCSMALSGRVLTLTGRMSVFRADLATHPDFITQVQSDFIDHWRLGRVRFLTGDDKSTWYWLLRHGYRMAYLPDVSTVSMETQPAPRFVPSAVMLMVRWFGNMLRTNGRALALGPSRIGAFTWWSILDQRLGIWTTLAGPISVIIGTLLVSPWVLPAYLGWVMFTRYAVCALLALVRRRGFPVSWPFLLYFSQIVGAAVKSYILFRLDRQRWTRQSSAPAAPTANGTRRSAGSFTTGLSPRLRDWSSLHAHALALGWLTLGVVLLSGLI